MEQMPRHWFGEVCVQEEVLALKNVLGYWLTRRDGEIGGRENGRDRGTRRVWAGPAPGRE